MKINGGGGGRLVLDKHNTGYYQKTNIWQCNFLFLRNYNVFFGLVENKTYCYSYSKQIYSQDSYIRINFFDLFFKTICKKLILNFGFFLFSRKDSIFFLVLLFKNKYLNKRIINSIKRSNYNMVTLFETCIQKKKCTRIVLIKCLHNKVRFLDPTVIYFNPIYLDWRKYCWNRTPWHPSQITITITKITHKFTGQSINASQVNFIRI